MATPMARAPHVTSDESGRPAERRGGARSARGRAPGSGNLEIWNPGNLRGCGARQVFRFSGFQVFTTRPRRTSRVSERRPRNALDHVHMRRVLCELREAVLEQVGTDQTDRLRHELADALTQYR